MSVGTNDIFSGALALPPASRAELAEKLLESLEGAPTEIQTAWADEAERRWEAFRRGEITAIPGEDVLQSLPHRASP